LVEVVELRPGSVQEARVIEKLETPEDWLWRSSQQGHEVGGAQKPMPLDVRQDFAVTWGDLYPGRRRIAVKSRKATGGHPFILPRSAVAGAPDDDSSWGLRDLRDLDAVPDVTQRLTP